MSFGAATLLAQFAAIATGFLVLRWVAPVDLGLWSAALLIRTYSGLLYGGLISGLNRELPFLMGGGDVDQAKACAGTVLQTVKVMAALQTSAIVLVMFLDFTPATKLCVAAALGCSTLDCYRSYLGATYRAHHEFRVLSRITWWESGTRCLTVPLVYAWGLTGLLVHCTATDVISTLLRHRFRPLRCVGPVSATSFRFLLNTGVPIFAFGSVHSIVASFPRLILAASGKVELVGVFAPAGALLGISHAFPTVLARYFYPQMTHELGRHAPITEIWALARRAMTLSLVLLVPCAVVLAVFGPFLVRALLPKYAGISASLPWVALTAVFMGTKVACTALNALKAWKWTMSVGIVTLAANLGLPCAFYRYGDSLAWLSAGVALAQCSVFSFSAVSVYRATHSHLPRCRLHEEVPERQR